MKRRDLLAASIASCVASLATHSLRGQARPLYRSSQTEAWTSDSVFLQGINAPVFEEVSLDNLAVTGEIPSDLQGAYIRNGYCWRTCYRCLMPVPVLQNVTPEV